MWPFNLHLLPHSVKIKYYESKLNLAWKPILKNIQEDPDGFIAQGGWEFLNMEVRRAV